MKRITALVLAVLMLLGTMTFPAFAEEEAEYPDFQFATALGFMDGEELYAEDPITRVQLAQVFHEIAFYNNGAESPIVYNAAETTDYAFADVTEEQKDAVKLVSDMGIMTGFPDGTFRPDATVTYHQLVKAMVCFLGYDAVAKELGGWTVGYLTIANRLGILPGGGISGEATATCGAVAQMLKMAVGVDVMLTTNGTAKVLDGVDYLWHWCKIRSARGTVTGNYLTNTVDNDETSYFSIYLDNEYMAITASAAGIQDKLGYSVTVYYKEVNGTNTILAYETDADNTVLEIDADEIKEPTTTRQITYTKDEGETTKTAALVKNPTVIYNGTYLASYTADDFKPLSDSKVMDGMVRLVDNNGDGTYDMVIVEAYSIYVVSTVNDGKIYNYFKQSEVVDISDYEERNINIINILGEPVLPGDIKTGQVINVCRDKNGKVKSIMASKDSLSGTVSAFRSNGTDVTHLTVNGAELEILSTAVTINGGNPITAGMNVTLYFSRRGKIAYIDGTSTINDGWKRGVMIDMAETGTLTTKVWAKVFAAEDSAVHDIYFPKKLEVNGTSTNGTEQQLLNAFGAGTDNRVKRQVFLYQTNEEGDTFTAVRVADKTGTFADGFYQFAKGDGTSGDDYEYSFKPVFKSFDDLFVIDENTTIFAVPSERHKYEDYALASLDSNEEGSKSMKADCYGTTKEGMVADMVMIDDSNATTASSGYNPIFLVTDVLNTKNEDKEAVIEISGIYVEGTTLRTGSFEIKKELVMSKFGSVPNQGDIFRLPSFRTTGKIEKFNGTDTNTFLDVFDFATKKFNSGSDNPFSDGSHTYRYGKVTDKIGNVIKLKHYNSTESSAVMLATASAFKVIEITTNSKGEFVSAKQSDASCIVAENDCPGAGSDLVTYNRGAGIAIFVFN